MNSYFSPVARTAASEVGTVKENNDSLRPRALEAAPNPGSSSTSAVARHSSGHAAVSTAFNPEIPLPPPYDYPPDLLVQSIPDAVLFHVHKKILLTTFNADFARLIQQFTEADEPIVFLNEPASVVNCLLHIVYDLSCRQYLPSLHTISQSLTTLTKYGGPLAKIVTPASNIFQHLLALAPSDPLGVYVIAAANQLEDLAVSVSPRALSVPLANIDESAAIAMGPSFLLRLVSLHTNRREAMKQLLLRPPNGHEDTPGCSPEQRDSLMRAYSLAVAYLAWEPIISADSSWISSVLSPLLPHITCRLCEYNMRSRIQAILIGWDELKCTI
ncbi:hypothetical protein BS47DRAFT_713247 [Hydnum rufescens UP504]|uniref:BTB domain-containing protein n=1 Tax=Hydnum rufescens UP504 TaxID=1448309 RepID=A0A9P6B1Q2_9AGAM|nr:hypothetical protein BS47DRAFT_713247 [Hydnum rufescens UP504]